jgi:4-hydroxyacetophenone monooxygenase
MLEQLEDAPHLIDRVIPDYPPGAKRILKDNGSWINALKRDDTRLVSESIQCIEPTGVRTVDGVLHEADVIAYATGFKASDFLVPMRVRGRDGELHDHWRGDARAYLGMMVPGFPNFFMLYGPNANLVTHGASLVYLSECQLSFVLETMRIAESTGSASMDVREDLFEEYNEEIDTANRLRSWGWSGVSSWYKNSFGRSAQNWPLPIEEYWDRTRQVTSAYFVSRTRSRPE